MNITVGIVNDATLRKEIENMIFGQVKAVTRQEIIDVVYKEVQRILSGEELSSAVDKILINTIQDSVTKFIRSSKNNEIYKHEIKAQVDKHVAELIKQELPGAVDRAVDHVMNRLTRYKSSEGIPNDSVSGEA